VNNPADNPWLDGGVGGDSYDKRFEALTSTGHDVHGEAGFVMSLGVGSVLDAGCGTGRVAIELARRGLDVAGIDLDASMLHRARHKAPELSWDCADLSDPDLDLGRRFDAVVMAGNVMIFVTPGTEGAVLASAVRHLHRPGLVIAGFSLRQDGLGVAEYDRLASEADLHLTERWSTWDRSPFGTDDTYAVSVHRYDPEP
jgi:SAM-dependent methyltransferase